MRFEDHTKLFGMSFGKSGRRASRNCVESSNPGQVALLGSLLDVGFLLSAAPLRMLPPIVSIGALRQPGIMSCLRHRTKGSCAKSKMCGLACGWRLESGFSPKRVRTWLFYELRDVAFGHAQHCVELPGVLLDAGLVGVTLHSLAVSADTARSLGVGAPSKPRSISKRFVPLEASIRPGK